MQNLIIIPYKKLLLWIIHNIKKKEVVIKLNNISYQIG